MSLLKESITPFMDTVSQIIEPGPATAETLSIGARVRQNQDAWQAVIDSTLIEWGRNLNIFQNDELEPFTKESIRKAWLLATISRNIEAPPPTRVVPDGNGGVVFEREGRSVFMSLNVDHTGAVELLTFKDGRLLSTQAIG